MRFLILCSWADAGSRTNKYNDEIIVNDFNSTNFDYVIDWDQYSPHSAKFPFNKKSIAFSEPQALLDFSDHNLNKLKSYYGHILSWHNKLRNLPQTKPFRYGTSWAPKGKVEKSKSFGISSVMRVKSNSLPGYQLRQKIIDNQWNINIPGIVYNYTGSWKGNSFTYPLVSKEPSFEWMFNLSIENCRENGYFTEKIIDCFQQYVVPLYFGDPDIDDFFVSEGIIKVDSTNIVEQINSLTKADYFKRKDAILENASRSDNFLDIFTNATLALTNRWNLNFVRKWK